MKKILLDKISGESNKEKMIKFVFLKIQSQEWQDNFKLPSARWFARKFKLSRALITSILNNFKDFNLLFSISNVGYFVNQKQHSLFYSYSTDKDIVLIDINHKKQPFNKNDLKYLQTMEPKSDLTFLEKFSNCIIKKYKSDKGYERIVYSYYSGFEIDSKSLPEPEVSIFKIFGLNYIPLVKQMTLRTLQDMKFNDFNQNRSTKGSQMQPVTYKIYWNYEKEVVLIQKITINPYLNNYYEKSLKNFFQN